MQWLPPDVDQILELLGAAAQPTGRVRRREEDRVKADMMNKRDLWMTVDPRAFQIRCYEVGLTSASTGALVRLLRLLQQGRSLRPRDKSFQFARRSRGLAGPDTRPDH